ncbi:hypothetical protein PDESU_01788 [Pontiella desulfatans]|uniref:Alginate export domain-containing protein n=1 Tax=Pontiella desulfatans TaxID=2750659 RepID=A0A6C2TZY9_PONDE|nr:hypothetical protein [Pontiella desulfatans]VGO13232.1 hypothetical protein PDESU_01788 [Pontiella desulfatans]
MKMRYTAILLATAFACGTTMAKESAEETPSAVATVSAEEIQKESQFKWGGDFRFRTVYMNHIPNETGADSGERSFQRYRTRVWGEYHQSDNLFVKGRLLNEFRTVQKPDGNNPWSAMDETIIDTLFVDYQQDLFGVRIGRQDMIYGTGKVILDGTPLDGSRTIYFDAAKATYKGIEDTTVDVFGMYTRAKNQLALHSQDRNLVGLDPAYDGAEAGGGVYVKNNAAEQLPWETYWVTKTKEQHLTDHFHTVGGRLMPKFGDHLSGNLEVAYQSNKDNSAYMVDALLDWQMAERIKLGLGYYHLSADWNPMFARWPQYSELYVYSFTPTTAGGDGIGYWSNASMPHVDLSISPIEKLKCDLLLGYMFAPGKSGPGDGRERGWLFTWWNKYTLMENLLSDKDKLFGHVLIELFEPGDFYTEAQQENLASFVRFELSYSF